MRNFYDTGKNTTTEKSIMPRILAFMAIAIVLFIIFGTAVAFVSKKAIPGANLRKIDPSLEKVQAENKSKGNVSAYAELGELRAGTRNHETVIVIEPWFPYPSEDTAFYEELSQKTREMKSIILTYFSAHSKDELMKKGENKVKEDILEEINNQLVLGKLKTVYFNEYLFLN